MNRIFKVIWSKAKECYIVVPEYAKSVTRASAKKVAVMAFAGLLCGGSLAYADNVNGIFVNDGVQAPSGGQYSDNTKGNNLLIKESDLYQHSYDIKMNDILLLGTKLTIDGRNSNTITGLSNTVWDPAHIDVVVDRAATEGQLLGIMHHYYSVNDNGTHGDNYLNDGATGANAMAAGIAASATGDNATAVGLGAQASVEDSVALGSSAVANTAAGIAGYDPITGEASTDTTAAWKSTKGAISVGDAANDVTRQITGVAAGTEDTDAVNVAQLKSATKKTIVTTETVEAPPAGQGGTYGEYTDGNIQLAQKVDDGQQYFDVKLNKDLNLTEEGSLTIGDTKITDSSVVAGNTTINNIGLIVGGNTYVTGNGINANNQKIVNVAPGTNDTDAVNFSQLKAASIHYYSVNDGGTQGGNYENNGATGVNALAAGVNASATGDNAVAIGNGSTANGKNSVALMGNTVAGENAMAWGYTNNAGGENATAWGYTNNASGVNATAWGYGNNASGIDTTAWGYGNKVSGEDATAWGNGNTASGAGATAWGYTNTASGVGATAWGYGNTASGAGATAWGVNDEASGNFATAFGNSSVALGDNSLAALGGVTGDNRVNGNSGGNNAVAIGVYAEAIGESSVALMSGFTSKDATKGMAWGDGRVEAENATAWGTSEALGIYSTAFGRNSEAYGDYSTAFGGSSRAYGDFSTAFGDSSYAYADNSLAALGGEAGAEGEDYGVNSAAIGYYARTLVDDSVALGSYAVADTEAGKAGYDPTTQKASTNTSAAWVATANAISVGDAENDVTRQITGVAAGTEDTDAVNVAQLKAATENAGVHYYSVNDGGTQGGNYKNDGATGVNALAAGVNAKATGDNAVAIGNGSTAEGNNSVALMGNTAAGDSAMVWGNGNTASGEEATAWGYNNTASGEDATAWGDYNKVSGNYATAWGYENTASGVGATAWGIENNVSGDYAATAWGYRNEVSGEDATAWGDYNKVSGERATAWGYLNNASGENATAWGEENIASGKNATAFGEYTHALGRAATSWGIEDTEAVGDYSTAWGFSKAYGEFSTSFGGGYDHKSMAGGRNSLAALGGTTGERHYDSTIYDYVFSGGENAVAIGTGAVSIGESSVTFMNGYATEDAVKGMAWGDGRVEAENATAWGSSSAYGDYSTAFGSSSEAYGDYSTAFGDGSYAYGESSTAFGLGSYAYGDYSTAFGLRSYAYAYNSFAALGGEAGVEGEDVGVNSAAIGWCAYTLVDDSIALGSYAVANTLAGKAGYDPTTGKASTDTSAVWVATQNAIAVGDAEEDVTRQITGVAAGTEDTDAVNVAQLKAASKKTIVTSNQEEAPAAGQGGTYGEYTKGNIQLAQKVVDGQLFFDVKLNNNLDLTNAGSITIGNTKITDGSVVAGNTTINNTGLTVGGNTYVTKDGLNANNQKIINVAAGVNDTDAVNVSQLKEVEQKAEAHNTVTAERGNITIKETTNAKGGINYDLDLSNDIKIGGKDGEAGKIGVAGKDGKDGVTIYAKDGVDGVDGAEGHIGLNGKDGVTDIYTKTGSAGVDGKDGITRIVYKDPEGEEHEVATKDDGLNFAGDDGVVIAKKLDEQLDIKGGAKGNLTDGNIGVVAENGALMVKLAENVNLGENGSVTTGDTVINNTGLTVGGNTYVTKNGINANNQKIINVAAGVNDTDAVNVSQLKEVKTIAEAHTTVSTSDPNVSVVESLIDGHTNYDIAIKATGEVKAGDTNIVNGDTVYNALANQEIVYKANGANEQSVKLSDGLNFSDGTNTTAEVGADGVVKYNLADNITLTDGGSITIGGTKITNNNVTTGNTTINNNGLTVGGKTYVTKDGINANNQKITNVAPGEADTDAVNVGQLKEVSGDINKFINKVDGLGNRINRVGARAAALAALHPLEFDPDDKLTFAAGYGNYKGENAGAIGAFYRPDEKVMFSVGGTISNKDNMINVGASFSLDRTPRQTNSKTAMAREILDLREHVAKQDQKIDELINVINRLSGGKDAIKNVAAEMFPDVPENHWAYEYIEGLQKAGIIEGYPDGNYGGDRSMTRYEYAAMLWRAMRAGQVIPEKLTNEFAAELGRFRVDRVSGADDAYHKVERIRVNGDREHNRDAYGSQQPQQVTSRGSEDVYAK